MVSSRGAGELSRGLDCDGGRASGFTLRRVEVVVDSESDDYGILGVDESVPAGPLSSAARVRIEAKDPADRRALVDAADRHCPVNDAVRRAVPWTIELLEAKR